MTCAADNGTIHAMLFYSEGFLISLLTSQLQNSDSGTSNNN